MTQRTPQSALSSAIMVKNVFEILTITLNSCANVILRRLRREEVVGSWGRARARATVDSRVGGKHHAQQRRFGT